jgi:hypothetical protein
MRITFEGLEAPQSLLGKLSRLTAIVLIEVCEQHVTEAPKKQVLKHRERRF